MKKLEKISKKNLYNSLNHVSHCSKICDTVSDRRYYLNCLELNPLAHYKLRCPSFWTRRFVFI